MLEAVETLEALPLPARCSFHGEGDGVVVEVAVPETTNSLRHHIEAKLHGQGVPLCDLRLVTDPAQLVDPLPLRGDLHERTFVSNDPDADVAMEARGCAFTAVQTPLCLLT